MNRPLARALGALLAGVVLAAHAPVARGDVTLTYDVQVKKPAVAGKQVTWYLTDTGLAVVTTGPTANRVIYRVKEDRLLVIDETTKRYLDLVGSDIRERAGRQGAQGAARMTADVEVLPMSETKEINGFRSRKNEIITGGAKSAESWTLSTGDATVTAAERVPMTSMVALLNRAVGSLDAARVLDLPIPTGLADGLQGVPVYTKDLEGDAIRVETTLTKLKRGNVPKKIFEIGKGYTKQELEPAGK